MRFCTGGSSAKTHTGLYTIKWRSEDDSSTLSILEDDEESLMLTVKK
jgi:hypothetical protein